MLSTTPCEWYCLQSFSYTYRSLQYKENIDSARVSNNFSVSSCVQNMKPKQGIRICKPVLSGLQD